MIIQKLFSYNYDHLVGLIIVPILINNPEESALKPAGPFLKSCMDTVITGAVWCGGGGGDTHCSLE